MIVRLTAIVLAAALLLIAVAAWADDLVAEPPGYRTENYRAPVPTTLNGARVLSTSETEAIWRTKSAAFIDVLPRPPKPKSLPSAQSGASSRVSTFPAASGCRTPAMACWRRRRRTI